MRYEIRDLSKKYRSGRIENEAVENVSFTAEQGQFIKITGRTGSGKSTLLELMTGFLRPSSGHIYLDGEDISEMDDIRISRIRNTKIGYVSQEQTLLGKLRVRENIYLPYYMSGRHENANKWYIELMEELDIMKLSDFFPNELSGGEQKRVMLARAMFNHPEVLIADEPTGNLDKDSALAVFDMFAGLSGKGNTIILVTHDRLAEEYGDVSYIMEEGKLL